MQNETPDIVPRTLQFALRIVRLCSQLIEPTGVSRTIGYQLLKSGTAVGAIVEEAQASRDKPEFAQRLSHALKKARQTNYWLRLLLESKVLEAIREETHEIQRTRAGRDSLIRKNSTKTSRWRQCLVQNQ